MFLDPAMGEKIEKLYFSILFPFFIAIGLSLLSCAKKMTEGEIVFTDIPISSYTKIERPLDDLELTTVVLSDGGRQDCVQSGISKVLCVQDKIFCLDGMQSTLVVYDKSGEAVAKVGIRGRGPQEYVQLSDFTVTPAGEIVLLDGNKDELLFFDSDCRFLRKQKNRLEISRLASVDGLFLMNVASWEQSGEFDYKVILCDEKQRERGRFIRNEVRNDPDFEFPYIGFLPADDGRTFFLKPIDDNLYVFSKDGLQEMYHFDFGGKTVKAPWRESVEKYYQDIQSCAFLVNTAYVTPDYCVGMMFDRGRMVSFYADLERKTLLDMTELGFFMGMADGCAIFYSEPGRYTDMPSIRLVRLPLSV